jgi:hypothetical protein
MKLALFYGHSIYRCGRDRARRGLFMREGETTMADAPGSPEPGTDDVATIMARAGRLQAAYAAARRAWAEQVGRPYQEDPDRRPPPGELDAASDEDE